MNWLLVFIIASAPVKTDLVFPTVRSCMTYERANAKVFADRANDTIKFMAEQNWTKDQREQNMNFVVGQAYGGDNIAARRARWQTWGSSRRRSSGWSE